MQTNSNAVQTSMFNILDASISRVFEPKDVKGKDGQAVGVTIAMRNRKEIAAELNLKGRDNSEALTEAILAQSDAAMLKAKSQISGLGADWTLAKLTSRTLGNGVRQITLVAKEIKRASGPSVEVIANKLGLTVEEVAAMIDRQQKQLKGIEVESEVQ